MGNQKLKIVRWILGIVLLSLSGSLVASGMPLIVGLVIGAIACAFVIPF